jgi:transcriptional regulator with XRE-family HTH domain
MNRKGAGGSMARRVDKLVGEALRSHRERCGLSVDQVGKLLGIPTETLLNVEAGGARASPQMLEALAAAFDVPISAFLEQILNTTVVNSTSVKARTTGRKN